MVCVFNHTTLLKLVIVRAQSIFLRHITHNYYYHHHHHHHHRQHHLHNQQRTIIVCPEWHVSIQPGAICGQRSLLIVWLSTFGSSDLYWQTQLNDSHCTMSKRWKRNRTLWKFHSILMVWFTFLRKQLHRRTTNVLKSKLVLTFNHVVYYTCSFIYLQW